MNRQTFRKIHRFSAPILFLPLLLTAITGIAYQLGRSWFGLSSDLGDKLLAIHAGEWLGTTLNPIYVLLLALGLVGMGITGIGMSRFWKQSSLAQADFRWTIPNLHYWLGSIFVLPLLVTAVTGLLYSVSQSWFGLSSEQAEIFIVIHQGEYLGKVGRLIYVGLVGVGILIILGTGIRMTRLFRQRRSNP